MARKNKIELEVADDTQAVRIHREVANDGSFASLIHSLDIRQNGTDARRCGRDDSHGRLTVHGNGQALVCMALIRTAEDGKRVRCDYAEPVSR